MKTNEELPKPGDLIEVCSSYINDLLHIVGTNQAPFEIGDLLFIKSLIQEPLAYPTFFVEIVNKNKENVFYIAEEKLLTALKVSKYCILHKNTSREE